MLSHRITTIKKSLSIYIDKTGLRSAAANPGVQTVAFFIALKTQQGTTTTKNTQAFNFSMITNVKFIFYLSFVSCISGRFLIPDNCCAESH